MNFNPKITNENFKLGPLASLKEITWTENNLNSLPQDTGCRLNSPSFCFQNAIWCLRLYPNHGSHIGLQVVRLSSRVPHHTLHCRLIRKDVKESVHFQVSNFDENHKENEIIDFIPRPRTQAFGAFGTAFSEPVVSNSVHVICQLLCYGPHTKDAFSQTEHFGRSIKDLGDLSSNFKNLLLNSQDHDVVLKVKDKEWRAHQLILRARSPVLESMLSHDMIEKNSGVIDIPDCDPDAFEQFLFYVYSGEAEKLDSGNMLSLYYIADKYDASHLKEVCREFIKNSFTYANVSNVVQLALKHNDAVLLDCATEYFTEKMCFVLLTVEWQSFLKHNPIQANELLIKATKRYMYMGKPVETLSSCEK